MTEVTKKVYQPDPCEGEIITFSLPEREECIEEPPPMPEAVQVPVMPLPFLLLMPAMILWLIVRRGRK
jgi:hypothetical protein